ncbi:MAG: hypothetical protein HYU78_12785 [Rhodocyclales bacterium]|nr:hypothetical protein [Rhodocyclales bacterium]MBI2308169.1 hypothetical protein [Rhodocyclales bacterium]
MKRLSIIGVPVGIKVAISATMLALVTYWGFGYVVTPTTFRNPAFVYELYSFAFACVFMFVFYWRIAVHLATVVKIQRSNPPLQGTPAGKPAAPLS